MGRITTPWLAACQEFFVFFLYRLRHMIGQNTMGMVTTDMDVLRTAIEAASSGVPAIFLGSAQLQRRKQRKAQGFVDLDERAAIGQRDAAFSAMQVAACEECEKRKT